MPKQLNAREYFSECHITRQPVWHGSLIKQNYSWSSTFNLEGKGNIRYPDGMLHRALVAANGLAEWRNRHPILASSDGLNFPAGESMMPQSCDSTRWLTWYLTITSDAPAFRHSTLTNLKSFYLFPQFILLYQTNPWCAFSLTHRLHVGQREPQRNVAPLWFLSTLVHWNQQQQQQTT